MTKLNRPDFIGVLRQDMCGDRWECIAIAAMIFEERNTPARVIKTLRFLLTLCLLKESAESIRWEHDSRGDEC